MSKRDLEKNLKLSAEFNEYIISHPKVSMRLTGDTCIVFIPKNDSKLAEKNRAMARDIMEKDKRECVGAVKENNKWYVRKLEFA